MARSDGTYAIKTIGAAFALTLLAVTTPLLRGGSSWAADGGAAGTPAIMAEPAAGSRDEIAMARARVKAEPANAALHARLAFLLMGKGNLDEAMRCFNDALTLNPRSFDAKTGKGAVLARQGKLKEAELALNEALATNPNPVRTHYELALVYEQLGDLERAIAEIREGLKKHEQGRN